MSSVAADLSTAETRMLDNAITDKKTRNCRVCYHIIIIIIAIVIVIINSIINDNNSSRSSTRTHEQTNGRLTIFLYIHRRRYTIKLNNETK